MKKRVVGGLYFFLWTLVYLGLMIWHPFSRFTGRERIPQGANLIVANHSSMADPLWILLALGPRRGAYIMGKKELMEIPVLRSILRWAGMIGVDRGGADLNAVKQSLEVLKNDDALLIFPEGTRVRPEKQIEAKTGAALLANRAGVPVTPVYITQQKRPFRPVQVNVGTPFEIPSAARRITAPELKEATAQMMMTIYGLES